ncbi:hypothetical protein MMC20_001533 [Loxospora ochrophaea]|nr:hypothetical protein [Loxospora ochrophaea]
MYFSNALLTSALFAVAAIAQAPSIAFTNPPTSVTAGVPIKLTWTGAEDGSPVTITLKQGDPQNLQTVAIVTGDATGGSFTWTPSKSIVNGDDYALQIAQGDEAPNYTGEFPISGGATSSASASISSVSASVSSAQVSSSIASILSAVNSSLSGVTSTLKPTIIGTGASSAGTGVPITRNTTLSSATLTKTSTHLATTTATSAKTTSATSATGASSTPSPTGSAATLSSSLVLILGAVAAMVFLN